MGNNLSKSIQAKIGESDDPNSAGTICFHWDKSNKTWCLSGSTKSSLYWESDDVEANNINDARSQAIDHLEAN